MLFQDSALYIDKLIDPILSCFKDQDQKVRYYACESLYNVVKVRKQFNLLIYTNIFIEN